MKLREDKTRFINNLPWETEEEKSKVLDFFKTHANLESKIQNWQSRDKEGLVNEIRNLISETEKASLEKEKAKQGYRGNIDWESHECRYLGEDEDWIYITPISYEGAKFCDSAECGGEGAKWCIGYEKSSEYWNYYRGKNALFLMKFNKHPKNKLKDLKFMIEGYLGKDKVDIWNQQDLRKKHTLSEIEKEYLKTIREIQDDIGRELVSKCFDNPKPGVYIAKNEEAIEHVAYIRANLKVFKVKEGVTFKNVKDASHMFQRCKSLKSIDTSGFVNVENASEMFAGCKSLKSIDTSGFVSVKDASHMFWGCNSLTSIDTSGFGNVEKVYMMFDSCTSLTSIDASVFVNVKSAEDMFQDCTSLTSIDTSGFENVKNADRMFNGCTSLTSIDTSAFRNVERAEGMFFKCPLTSIDTSPFVNIKTARAMFGGCTSLTLIDTSAFVNVKDASGMFAGCTSLTSIDTSAFKNVERAEEMFSGCTSLTSIDASPFVNVWNTLWMFYGCKSLKTYISGSNSEVNEELEKIGAKPVKKLGESRRRRVIEEILED